MLVIMRIDMNQTNTTKPIPILDTENHQRDIFDVNYVYPVVSRRAGGLSIGINLNVNNACNWRCIYCEIPDLRRGGPPPIDLVLLAHELDQMLAQVVHGEFLQHHVEAPYRRLQDIAFSGNGEPTSAAEFADAIALVEQALQKFSLLHQIKVRLITNGSLIDKPAVQSALQHLARINGEVWFKLDAGTRAGIQRINDVPLEPQRHLQRLLLCASLCPTIVQTCLFKLDGQLPAEAEIIAYLGLLQQAREAIQGVHLYSIARPSLQAEAPRLSRLNADELQTIADSVAALGIPVTICP